MPDKYVTVASLVLKQMPVNDLASAWTIISNVSAQQGFEFTRQEKVYVRDIVAMAIKNIMKIGEAV